MPVEKELSASVAQLVEQLICNQLVGGSSPSTGSVSGFETFVLESLSVEKFLSNAVM